VSVGYDLMRHSLMHHPTEGGSTPRTQLFRKPATASTCPDTVLLICQTRTTCAICGTTRLITQFQMIPATYRTAPDRLRP
jgi:hypothetical protein